MKITRRELAAALGSAATLRRLPAESPPADLTTAAKEQIEKNAEALAKVELPMSTEPAFQFKA
ncbi:MAG TPA: hypothetical protein VJN43_23590 [Bryobacteraceae bacterium]|nr:hypothetical protein [Bryobacteraceae bacterium]